jgi:hypothetical protein
MTPKVGLGLWWCPCRFIMRNEGGTIYFGKWRLHSTNNTCFQGLGHSFGTIWILTHLSVSTCVSLPQKAVVTVPHSPTLWDSRGRMAWKKEPPRKDQIGNMEPICCVHRPSMFSHVLGQIPKPQDYSHLGLHHSFCRCCSTPSGILSSFPGLSSYSFKSVVTNKNISKHQCPHGVVKHFPQFRTLDPKRTIAHSCFLALPSAWVPHSPILHLAKVYLS